MLVLVLRDDPVYRESWLSVKVNPERETQTVQLLESHLVTGDTWLKSDPPLLPSPAGLLPDGSSQFVAAGFSLLAAGRRSRRYLLCEPLCELHAGDIISFHPGPQKVICCNPNRFQAEPETPGPGSRCW